MVEAAPADEPQIAVVPGRMPIRVIVQPQSVLTPITERMMARKRSQLPEKVTRRSGLIEAAIIIASTT
jgi:hypothetical protein